MSDVRISQVNFPALSGKAATRKEKHAKFSKQEKAYSELSSTTILARAVMYKKESFSSMKLTQSIPGVFTSRLITDHEAGLIH